MSYLELSTGLADFDKAVISLWFRVPQESIDAATAQAIADDGEDDLNVYFPALWRTIPLVTFGSLEHAMTSYGDGTNAYPVASGYVGVNCDIVSLANPAVTLAVHLQMPNTMTFQMTPMESDADGGYGEPQGLHTLQRKDAFYMSGNGSKPYYGDDLSQLVVTPDVWHQVLISFDLTEPATVIYSTAPQNVPPFAPATMHPLGGPKFMWAFDDVDKTDWSLSPSSAQVYNVQPPGSGVTPAPIVPFEQITTNNLIDLPSGAWAFIGTWDHAPIKSSANPIGIPTAAHFVDSVYPVELAELQFFTGVTLDTRIEANRRVFITAEGTPVDPAPMIDNPDYDPDLPEGPSNPQLILNPDGGPAAQLLGKKPDILLHGSDNWTIGKNTGPMIDNPDYDPSIPVGSDNPKLIPDPAKQFTPTGKIVSYTPDPSLHGPQSPDTPPPLVRLQRRIRVAA
jgi:hypothetical protein